MRRKTSQRAHGAREQGRIKQKRDQFVGSEPLGFNSVSSKLQDDKHAEPREPLRARAHRRIEPLLLQREPNDIIDPYFATRSFAGFKDECLDRRQHFDIFLRDDKCLRIGLVQLMGNRPDAATSRFD